MPLEEYKNIVGILTGVATIGQQFAPAFLCLDIMRQGSTRSIDRTPFIGGVTMSALMLQHGLILHDPTMITVNVFALIMNLIYFGVYYAYEENKSNLLNAAGKAGALVAVLVSYVRLDEPVRAEFYYGVAVTILMFALIAAPLASFKEVIRTKSSEKLPFPLILAGTVVTGLWLLYGTIIQNIFIQFQSFVGFLLSSVQLCLCIIYPSKPTAEKKSD